MPRGNLEGVCPRTLVLAAVASALQERRYAAAWELAITNRVGGWAACVCVCACVRVCVHACVHACARACVRACMYSTVEASRALVAHQSFPRARARAPLAQVDLNLLVDWGWPAFLHDAPAFVAAVHAPSDLTDLLFALRPGNVCEEGGLYAGIPTRPSAASPQVGAPSAAGPAKPGVLNCAGCAVHTPCVWGPDEVT